MIGDGGKYSEVVAFATDHNIVDSENERRSFILEVETNCERRSNVIHNAVAKLGFPFEEASYLLRLISETIDATVDHLFARTDEQTAKTIGDIQCILVGRGRLAHNAKAVPAPLVSGDPSSGSQPSASEIGIASGLPPPPPLVDEDILSHFRISIVEMAKIMAFLNYFNEHNVKHKGPRISTIIDVAGCHKHDMGSVVPTFMSTNPPTFTGFIPTLHLQTQEWLIRDAFVGVPAFDAMQELFYGTDQRAHLTSSPMLFARSCAAARLGPFERCMQGVSRPHQINVLDPSSNFSFEEAIDAFEAASAPSKFVHA